MRDEFVIPEGVRDIVKALCADYERRRKVIKERSASPRVENEYRYYNTVILESVTEIVGKKYAEALISDIGSGGGYWQSCSDFLSESTYKRRKRAIINNIAFRLHLL